jgi:hypothetical protein
MKNKIAIALSALGGILAGVSVVGGIFWIFSMLISFGFFNPEGIHYLKNSNGDVVYIDGQQCTIDTTDKSSVEDVKTLFKHCIDHHQKFLNNQQ